MLTIPTIDEALENLNQGFLDNHELDIATNDDVLAVKEAIVGKIREFAYPLSRGENFFVTAASEKYFSNADLSGVVADFLEKDWSVVWEIAMPRESDEYAKVNRWYVQLAPSKRQ